MPIGTEFNVFCRRV